jgi:hypothetical protein
VDVQLTGELLDCGALDAPAVPKGALESGMYPYSP